MSTWLGSLKSARSKCLESMVKYDLSRRGQSGKHLEERNSDGYVEVRENLQRSAAGATVI